jgi:DNA-binding LacI/PurR family transcriptional regulator
VRVSIVDIARRAGVSHSTVSRALADSPLVNAETKTRIQRLAHEMGYTPSAIARAMSTRRTHTLGLVVTTIADPFVAEVVRGIEETALDQGYNVILCNSQRDPDRELAAVRTLREKWVDAVIVTSSWVGSAYDQLTEIQVPVVLINNQQPGEYTSSVRNDDLSGGALAGNYLTELGHTRIAYVAGPEGARASQLRLEGCQRVLEAKGLTIPEDWIVPGTGLPESGERAVQSLLDASPKPTALFCYNDMTAMGALRAAKERGVHVPLELSVLGYDDISAAAYLDPPLTTVAQAKHNLGQLATEMALALIQGAQDLEDVLLQPTIITRSSCGIAGQRKHPAHSGQRHRIVDRSLQSSSI